MDEAWKDSECSRARRLALPAGVLLLLVAVVVTAVTLGYFAVEANSEACQDGLRAVERCHNATHHLQDQLTQAQKTLQAADAACNGTVENLNAALTQMKTQERKQQKQVQDLRGEIEKLKQKLQEAQDEVQRLRDKINASSQMGPKNAASLQVISIVLVPAALLLLGLAALWP